MRIPTAFAFLVIFISSTAIAQVPQCRDGVDNDRDGLTDALVETPARDITAMTARSSKALGELPRFSTECP